jgi:hypothetical protein
MLDGARIHLEDAYLSKYKLLVEPFQRPAALINLVSPENAAPKQELYIWGRDYDVQVTLTVTNVERPGAFDHSYVLTTRHADDVGDYVAWELPPEIPPGSYRCSVWNAQAAGSNPGYFQVHPPYPTVPYVVAWVNYIHFRSLDGEAGWWSPGDGEELCFDFSASTKRPGHAPRMQRIRWGDNSTAGIRFLANSLTLSPLSSSGTYLVPAEMELPIFVCPQDTMGDALMFAFSGQEYDKATSTTAYGIAGSIAGAAVGAYFGGAAGAKEGFTLGGDVATKLAKELGDSGNDSYGIHTNSFVAPEFGSDFAGYPGGELPFDNNTGSQGRNVQIGYSVAFSDAPRVRNVRVKLDRIDTSHFGFPPAFDKLYVRARVIENAGEQFPDNTEHALKPETARNSAATVEQPYLLLNEHAHDLPMLFVEISLWANVNGYNKLVGRPYTRLFWPSDLLGPIQTHVSRTVHDTVNPPLGHGNADGRYSVVYTITMDRIVPE